MSQRGWYAFRDSESETEEFGSAPESPIHQTPESEPEPLASSTLFPYFEQSIEVQPSTPFQNLINIILLNSPTQTTMAASHISNGTKELQINPPTNFMGNRNDLKNFIQDCTLYMTLIGAIYDTDEKKIIFMLSYM